MKRDMDLVRKILFELEDTDGMIASYDTEVIDGYEYDAVHYHLTILSDSPYVLATPGYRGGVDSYRLTWQGHEFLESIRDDKVWNQLQDASKKAGSATVEAIGKAALAIGIQALFAYLNLPKP